MGVAGDNKTSRDSEEIVDLRRTVSVLRLFSLYCTVCRKRPEFYNKGYAGSGCANCQNYIYFLKYKKISVKSGVSGKLFSANMFVFSGSEILKIRDPENRDLDFQVSKMT